MLIETEASFCIVMKVNAKSHQFSPVATGGANITGLGVIRRDNAF